MVVFRWVDNTLCVHENFTGLYSLHTIEASSIVSAVRDTLAHLNLPISKARGQCYNSASNMSGLRNGVATQIQADEPRAIYTQSYSHSLNLAASDTIKKCRVMRVAMETTFEITKLVKYSPRRERLFEEIKDDIAPGFPGTRVLCPT